MTHPLITNMTNDQLVACAKRTGRLTLAGFVCVLLCIALGVWVDWRWLPTTIVPLAAMFTFGWGAGQFSDEIDRRVERRKSETA